MNWWRYTGCLKEKVNMKSTQIPRLFEKRTKQITKRIQLYKMLSLNLFLSRFISMCKETESIDRSCWFY